METVQTLGTSEYYYRDNIVISVFSNIFKVLDSISKDPEATYHKLKKILKISGGSLHNRLKDAKTMGLYTNGHGKHLTELGKKWLAESIQNNGIPSKEILKQTCLQVPLFNLIYNQDMELVSANKIFEFFKRHDPENQMNDKFIKMAVKRYLEGIHDFKVQRRARINLYKYQSTLPSAATAAMASGGGGGATLVNINEYVVLHKQLKEWKEKYGLESLKKILEIL